MAYRASLLCAFLVAGSSVARGEDESALLQSALEVDAQEGKGKQPIVIQLTPQMLNQAGAAGAGQAPQIIVLNPQQAGAVQPQQTAMLATNQVKQPTITSPVEVTKVKGVGQPQKTGLTALQKEHIHEMGIHKPKVSGHTNPEIMDDWYQTTSSWNNWFKRKMSLWTKYRPYDARVYNKWIAEVKTDAANRCKWIGSNNQMKSTDDLYAQVTKCMWSMLSMSKPLPPFTPPFVQKLLQEEASDLRKQVSGQEYPSLLGQPMVPQMQLTLMNAQASPLRNQWMFSLMGEVQRSNGWDSK